MKRKDKVRVGIDGGLACSPRPTGVEYFARSVLLELAHQPPTEVEWFFYLPPGGVPGHALAGNVRLRPDVNTRLKTPWLVASTWRDRLDVLVSFGHQLPSACRGRRVITIHDTIYEHFPECYPDGVPRRLRAELLQACRDAARVLVPSHSTQQDVTTLYGVPADRVDVVLEGIRADILETGPMAVPERYFLSVGRLDRRKNVERVVAAYRRLVGQGVPCGSLLIVGPRDAGSGPLQELLQRDVVTGEDIVVTGYLDSPQLGTLYRNAVALVFPSLAEGFGLPVLEAMALGTPVITSRASSMLEVAGDAALLVDPLDTDDIALAMRRLVLETDLRERLSVAGQQQAARFSWADTAARITAAVMRTSSAGGEVA